MHGKRIKYFAALLILAALLTGCGDTSAESPADAGAQETEAAAYETFCEGRTFITDLPDEDLEKPGRTIGSPEDFIYALDYLAFYRISDKVFFDIDPAYAGTIYNPYREYQRAYEAADLADVYACQLDDAYYSEFGVLGIKYSVSRDIASEAPETIPDTPVLTSFDYLTADAVGDTGPAETGADASGRDSAGTGSAADSAGAGETRPVSCENSEQLYYLVMNGYTPLPDKGSMAETLYGAAQEVIRQHIRADMTDFQKVKAVYDYLTSEVRYDAATAYTSDTYLVKEQAYYLEGVFLNHCAVCDGKAKACALLLNMAGIPCWRTTGVNEGGDHAWNMVQLDGKWYVLCTTYGQKNRADTIGRIVPDYSMLLAGAATPYEWYPAQKHKDIEALLSGTPYDIFGQMGADDGICLKVETLDDLKALLSFAENCGKQEYKAEFMYTGSDADAFQQEMTDYLGQFDNINAAEVKSETGKVYQVLCLDSI